MKRRWAHGSALRRCSWGIQEAKEKTELMHYLLCKHKVADYTKWRRVFDADAGGQRESGLHLLHVLRDTADPDMVVLLFRADDLDKARAFTEAPSASESAQSSGVIGEPEILFLTE